MFLIHTRDYFKDFDMILNDNIIDCFHTYPLNEKDSQTTDLNSNYYEINKLLEEINSNNNIESSNNSEFLNNNIFINPKMPSKYELTTLSREKLTTLSKEKLTTLSREKLTTLSKEKLTTLSREKLTTLSKEKLNKNKIYNNDNDYNGYRTTRNVESFKNNSNYKDERNRYSNTNSKYIRPERNKSRV